MSLVPRTKRSEYQGAYKDLQEQIDELRRKIEEIQEKDRRYPTIFQPDRIPRFPGD